MLETHGGVLELRAVFDLDGDPHIWLCHMRDDGSLTQEQREAIINFAKARYNL